MIEFFDLDAILAYTRAQRSALTATRVGFFLEQHRDALMVERQHLWAFRDLAPGQPRYLDTSREPGKLVKDWNLVVPEMLTGDGAMRELLRGHPGLRWKALNVRRHHGLGGGSGELDEGE